MSHAARRGSLVALPLVLAGCSLSRDVVRDEPTRPLTDMPRTAPSAREQALKSIGPQAPAPHLNAAMIRAVRGEAALQPPTEEGKPFTGFGLVPSANFQTTFEPMHETLAGSAAVPAAAFAPAAASAPSPEPAAAPEPQKWITGGPWREWTSAAQAETSGDSDPDAPRPNDGQDPLRPRRRLELRFAYSKLQYEGTRGTPAGGAYGTIPGPTKDFRQGVTTLRLDLPTGFPDRWINHGWTLATSIEVPWVSTDVPGPDSNEDRETGIGDASAQMIFIPTRPGSFEWGFGAKGTFPTARMEQMGTGRWTVSPTAIFMWHPKWMSNDGFFGVTLRDTFDTGRPDDRAEIHYGTIQPQIQVNLGRKWFVATQPEIRCDFRHDDNWYVPADLMIGTLLGERWLISLDGQYAITNHSELAEWTVEARLAFFF
jgi:hypothetical protein